MEETERDVKAERQKVYDIFDELRIPFKVFEHPPINSAAERISQGVEVDGVICKNLFLRNKEKSRYYLYTLPIDKRADLAALQKMLGETRLSFGDPDALWDRLYITPGSVSLLNIIGERAAALNSAEARPLPQLKFLIDSEALSAEPGIGLHPNDNAATVVFKAEHLKLLLDHYGADYEFITI